MEATIVQMIPEKFSALNAKIVVLDLVQALVL
jgi:hypothetical protein